MLAAAALAFFACNKEIEQPIEESQEVHYATVTINKAGDTKTAVVEGSTSASYKWTEGDQAYLHIYENNIEGNITNMALTDNDAVATFTVAFDGSTSESYTYSAVYAKELTNKADKAVVQATQYPKSDNFDPGADIMISKKINANERKSSLSFTMGRVVTINKMTLTGLVSGEKIKKVEFELTDGYMVSRIAISDNSLESVGKKLTLEYAVENTDHSEGFTVGSEGTFPVYFISAPVASSGIKSVIVTTNQNVYTKSNTLTPNPFEGKSISFAVGTMMRFSMGLSGFCEPVSTGTPYSKVNDQAGLVSGANYLIVGNNANLVAMGEQTNNNRGAVSVSATSGVITIDNTIAAHPVKIEKVGDVYTIQDLDSGYYLYTNNTGANRLLSTSTVDDYAKWNISISSGIASITNVGNTSRGVMCYNGSGTSKLFACYASISSSYNNLSLYIDHTSYTTEPTIVTTPSSVSDISYKGVTDAEDITFELKNFDSTPTVSVTYDGTVVTDATDVDEKIVYSVSKNTGSSERNGWIKISAGGKETTVAVSQSGAPSYTITLGSVTDGKVYVGANENDEVTFTVTSNYLWTADYNYNNGVTDSYVIDPEDGNPNDDESDVTTITVTAYEANPGNADRFLGTITIDNGGEPTTSVAVWQYGAQADQTFFLESFDDQASAGGRDGNFGTSSNAAFESNPGTEEEWVTYTYSYPAHECVKMGSSKNNGELTTASISLTGSAKLYFEAAGWSGSDTNSLSVTATGATLSGDTNITLVNSTWTGYNVNITGATGSVTITFTGKRLFLDNVIVYTGTKPTIKASPGISFETPSYSFKLNDTNYSAFTGQAVTNPNSLSVTYKIEGDDIGSINESSGVVSLDGSTLGTATVTATFAGNDSYKSDDVSYTITVESAGGSGGTPTSVVYDFTESGWTVSNGTLSNGTVSFTGEGAASFKMNTGYFMLGKANAYISFPTYSYPVTKIVVTGRSGASASVVQNIYVGITAVSTATTGATGTNTYLIDSNYQAAGTTYTLKVTSSHNTQITQIEVFF